MSGENVEVVRAAYDCLNADDAEGLIRLCHDDFVMDMSERVFNPDTYRGADGIRRFCEEVKDAWHSYRWQLEDTRVTEDCVVAMLHCVGHGHEGGPAVDWRVAWVWRFRESVPVSLRFYRDRAAALEAVGLLEDDARSASS